ncbi:hypothetical protein AMECASPLE_024185 [Ameca splendens]|uniref:Uncharacterized protein n=1 Tax=Ameca splendens TaxID=208324 RepID=A0ABV0XT71_9TELE
MPEFLSGIAPQSLWLHGKMGYICGADGVGVKRATTYGGYSPRSGRPRGLVTVSEVTQRQSPEGEKKCSLQRIGGDEHIGVGAQRCGALPPPAGLECGPECR